MFIGVIYIVVTIGYVYQHYIPGEVFLVGGLVTLLSYVQFTSVFQDIAWQYTEIIRYNTEVQTARAIGEAYREHHRVDEAGELPENWQEIHISNLNFSHGEVYNAEKRAHSLHGLDIRFRRGQRIAFIGESGKSTLLALLRGLYQPEKGTIVTVDNRHKAAIDMLADQVTLFPQDPKIFENTIAYNITLGLPF